MTREEFAEVKKKLTPLQREQWNGMLPECDEATFLAELSRPDGMIPMRFVEPEPGPRLWFI